MRLFIVYLINKINVILDMAFFSERLFYVIIVLGLTITAIVVPIVILKQQPLAVTFFFIGPNGSGPIFITPRPPEKQEEFTTRLGLRAGMTTTTEESNATTNASGAQREMGMGEHAADLDFNPSDFVKEYLGVDDMDKYFNKIVKDNKPYMDKKNYPSSVQGRDMMLIKIDPTLGNKKIILIVSGIGGGDWRSPLLTIFVMNSFLQANESKSFLEHFAIHFIPLYNPDVYNWTRTAPPMNRSYQYNAAGVNLIRDFGTDTGSKKKQKPKQPETEFFLNYFNDNKEAESGEGGGIRVIILFEALPEELEGSIEMRICLPSLLKEKKNVTYNYFLKRYPGYQMCEEKDFYHLSNWVITQTTKNPIITFSLQVNYKPDVFLDNLQFMLRYGQRFYEFLQDFLLIVKDEKAKDPLGMHPKGKKGT